MPPIRAIAIDSRPFIVSQHSDHASLEAMASSAQPCPPVVRPTPRRAAMSGKAALHATMYACFDVNDYHLAAATVILVILLYYIISRSLISADFSQKDFRICFKGSREMAFYMPARRASPEYFGIFSPPGRRVLLPRWMMTLARHIKRAFLHLA